MLLRTLTGGGVRTLTNALKIAELLPPEFKSQAPYNEDENLIVALEMLSSSSLENEKIKSALIILGEFPPKHFSGIKSKNGLKAAINGFIEKRDKM